MSSDSFQFFLNQKKHVAVVSFLGSAGEADERKLIQCHDLIAHLQSKYLVFNFSGLNEFHADLYPVLVRMQSSVREGDRELIVCGMNSKLKKELTDSGIVRSYETVDTLVEALQQIVSKGGGS